MPVIVLGAEEPHLLFPADRIKLRGVWRSDCYHRSLDPDLQTKFSIAEAMGNKGKRDRCAVTSLNCNKYSGVVNS